MAWQFVAPRPAVGAPKPVNPLRGIYAIIGSNMILALGIYLAGVVKETEPYMLFWIISLLLYLIGGSCYINDTKHTSSTLPDQLALLFASIRMFVDLVLGAISILVEEYYLYNIDTLSMIMFLLVFIPSTIFIGSSLSSINKKTKGAVAKSSPW